LQAGAASLVEAVRAALVQVKGAFAIVVLSDNSPGVLVAAKNASPLVVGVGQGEMFLASDAAAILEQTREMLFLEDGDRSGTGPRGRAHHRSRRKPSRAQARSVTWTAAQAEKAAIRTSCSRRSTSSRTR